MRINLPTFNEPSALQEAISNARGIGQFLSLPGQYRIQDERAALLHQQTAASKELTPQRAALLHQQVAASQALTPQRAALLHHQINSTMLANAIKRFRLHHPGSLFSSPMAQTAAAIDYWHRLHQPQELPSDIKQPSPSQGLTGISEGPDLSVQQPSPSQGVQPSLSTSSDSQKTFGDSTASGFLQSALQAKKVQMQENIAKMTRQRQLATPFEAGGQENKNQLIARYRGIPGIKESQVQTAISQEEQGVPRQHILASLGATRDQFNAAVPNYGLTTSTKTQNQKIKSALASSLYLRSAAGKLSETVRRIPLIGKLVPKLDFSGNLEQTSNNLGLTLKAFTKVMGQPNFRKTFKTLSDEEQANALVFTDLINEIVGKRVSVLGLRASKYNVTAIREGSPFQISRANMWTNASMAVRNLAMQKLGRITRQSSLRGVIGSSLPISRSQLKSPTQAIYGGLTGRLTQALVPKTVSNIPSKTYSVMMPNGKTWTGPLSAAQLKIVKNRKGVIMNG